MPDQNVLALRAADQARTDFAALESELEVIQMQRSRLPTRAYFCRTLWLATASIWVLIGRSRCSADLNGRYCRRWRALVRGRA